MPIIARGIAKYDISSLIVPEQINSRCRSSNRRCLFLDPKNFQSFAIFGVDYTRNSLKKDEDYFTITGELSGLELYVNLYKYNGKLLIIKDSDTSLRDENFVKIFQQAIDPKAIRSLRRPLNSSLTDSAAEDPDTFEFTGKIIFISSIPKKKIISLFGKQSNVLEVVLKKQDMTRWLWVTLPFFEHSSVRINIMTRNIALNLLLKTKEEVENIELSRRSLQKAILIVNKLGHENDEIAFNLIKQHCSFVPNFAPNKENANSSRIIPNNIQET